MFGLAPTIITFFLSAFLFFTPCAYSINAIVIDISNRAYFDAVVNEINNAKETIYVAMYAFYVERKDSAGTADKLLQALVDAKARDVVVKVYLDASKGSKKANYAAYIALKNAGVSVAFVDRFKLHAKVIVIDSNTVITGSANWTKAASLDNIESNIILRSQSLALSSVRFFDELEKVAMPDPNIARALREKIKVTNEFLLNKDTAAVMLRDNDEHAFNLYLWLLYKDAHDWINIDYKLLARYLGMNIKPDAPKYRYDIRRVATKLKDKYNLIDHELDKKNNLRVKLLEQKKGYFNLPLAYWEYGLDKLNLREKFTYLICLYEHEMDFSNEFWWRDLPGLAEKYYVEKNVILKGMNTLEDMDILEIHRSARQGENYADRLANRYRLKPLLSPREKAIVWKAMRKRWGQKLFNEAREAARLLERENHLTVVEQFILLINQYGYEKVTTVASKVSAYAHSNPMRDIRYIAELLTHAK